MIRYRYVTHLQPPAPFVNVTVRCPTVIVQAGLGVIFPAGEFETVAGARIGFGQHIAEAVVFQVIDDSAGLTGEVANGAQAIGQVPRPPAWGVQQAKRLSNFMSVPEQSDEAESSVEKRQALALKRTPDRPKECTLIGA